ncbi:alpha/beta-hydrolase [Meredithblackwellia eburnea MCA 4105]
MTYQRMHQLPPTAYSRQPWKAYYIITRIIYVQLLKPYWAFLYLTGLSHLPRSWSLREQLIVRTRQILQHVISQCDIAHGTRDIGSLPDTKTLNETRAVWIPPAGKEWVKGMGKSEEVGTVRVPGYVWGRGKSDKGDIVVEEGEKVVLFFHGGGLASGSAHESDDTAVIPRNLLKMTSVQHVLSVDYRKVQVSPFPAQILDCISAWAYLVTAAKVPPSSILLAGDSAGGHLALAVTRYLRDGGFGLPGGLLMFSPWTDMSGDLPPKLLRYVHLNTGVDFLNFRALQPYIAHRLLGTSPVSLLDNPILSSCATTVSATRELFENFPPCFVTAGGKEILLEQIRELDKRLKLSGVDVEYHEQPDAMHDFELFDWFNPAAREKVWGQAASWVSRKFLKV